MKIGTRIRFSDDHPRPDLRGREGTVFGRDYLGELVSVEGLQAFDDPEWSNIGVAVYLDQSSNWEVTDWEDPTDDQEQYP